jgi:hypothetical protein
MCDSRTVNDEDLVLLKMLWPDREAQFYSVRPGKTIEHKWYYAFKQTLDEVMMIKIFDSKTDGCSRGTPHSAFKDEEFVNEAPRESLEIRVAVLHVDDTE